MKIKLSYDNQDDIPSGFEALYTEKDGKWVLTGVEGIQTTDNVKRLEESLRKERKDHKETKEKLEKFESLGDKDPEDILKQLDRIEELEVVAEGKIDEGKMDELVEKRVKAKLAPIERENTNLKKQLGEKDEAITTFTTKERNRTIGDAVRTAAQEMKVIDTAVEDILVIGTNVFEVNDEGKVVTKDGVGVTPGIEASVWLQEMQEKRPHWWPPSQGGGARGGANGGGFAENPFSHEHWNMTKQGEIIRTNRAKAEQMAKSAGTTIGGQRPAPKK